MTKEEQELFDFLSENKEFLENMFTHNLFYPIDKIESNFINFLIRKKISKQDILNAQKNDNTVSIEEIGELLEIDVNSIYTNKKKYLNRALYFLENYKKEDKYFAKLLYALGTFYKFIGKDNKIYFPLYKKALHIQRKILDKNHIDIANSCAKLGMHYTSPYKRRKRVIFLLEYALKIKEKVLGIQNNSVIELKEELFIMYEDSYIYRFTNSKNSSLSFKINKIEIQNFKQFSFFEMNFSKQINIIVGQNATGKTSLLQAITLSLLREDSPDELSSYRFYINKSNRTNNANLKVHFDGYEKNIKILRDKREIENDYFIPFVLSYGSNFFTEYFMDSKHKVKEMLEKKIDDSLANSIFEDFVTDFENPLGILESLEFSRRKNAKEIQSIFLETLNSFLEEYQITSNVEGDFFFIKGEDKTPLYLNDLSEGYRSNVLLISDMLIKILGVGWTPKTIEGIVLIDEFDKHLHPRWQSRLINQLTETFPKIQFIMTTHNPMSILDRNPDEITILKEIDGEIKAIKESGTKNIDVGMILLKYFNVDSIVGDSMRKNLNEITQIKLKGRRKLTKEDKERIKEIEQELQYSPATDFIYNGAYFNFLVFLKENKGIDFEDYENLKDKNMLEIMEEYKDLF